MEKREHMIAWGGGLGDMINNMYSGTQYCNLAHLEPNVHVYVALMCHNPSAKEIFEWHPKRDQLTVVNVGFQKQEDIAAAWDKAGIPWKRLSYLPASLRRPIIWYVPGPTDFGFLGNKKYVVFSTTGTDTKRHIPISITTKIIDHILDTTDYHCVIVGKNYTSIDGHKAERIEQEFCQYPRVHNLIDKLTVPETASLIEGACGVVCSHSAINALAWHMDKPQILLYDAETEKRHGFDTGISDQWSWGQNKENTFHACFDNFDNKWDKIKDVINDY